MTISSYHGIVSVETAGYFKYKVTVIIQFNLLLRRKRNSHKSNLSSNLLLKLLIYYSAAVTHALRRDVTRDISKTGQIKCFNRIKIFLLS